ncbi:MAG: prolyl-tRNA synthetase associated domain-containing protein, partial [Lachnospiraceae bacterium]|nr:prolyl-tRNA synthetase associated domain-containing protein [Lachnospiraceae bacterium]
MELFQGRPLDVTGRLPREVRVYDYLDRLNIPYERTDHEEVHTMEDLYEADKILGVVLCKNLFLCNR